MQNVSRRGFLRSLVSAPAAVVAAVALLAAVAARPRVIGVGERGPEMRIPHRYGVAIKSNGRKVPIRVAAYEPDPAKRSPPKKPTR